jgi:co-chaperonin GroES (HSP10)
MNLHPLHDWILVKLDPVDHRQGSIILPLGQVYRTATVLRVGPGRALKSGARAPVGVKAGDRVTFRREHLEHQQGKQIMSVLQDLGEDLGLIREPDVLYVEMKEPVLVDGAEGKTCDS